MRRRSTVKSSLTGLGFVTNWSWQNHGEALLRYTKWASRSVLKCFRQSLRHLFLQLQVLTRNWLESSLCSSFRDSIAATRCRKLKRNFPIQVCQSSWGCETCLKEILSICTSKHGIHCFVYWYSLSIFCQVDQRKFWERVDIDYIDAVGWAKSGFTKFRVWILLLIF